MTAIHALPVTHGRMLTAGLAHPDSGLYIDEPLPDFLLVFLHDGIQLIVSPLARATKNTQ